MKSKTTILLGILVVTFVASLVSRFGMQFLGMSREHMANRATKKVSDSPKSSSYSSMSRQAKMRESMTSGSGREHATGISEAVKSLQAKMIKKSSSSGKENFTTEFVPMPVGGEVSSFQGKASSDPKPVSLKPYENANDNELFQYQNSKFTAECCPSAITNDVGCLCATDKEKKDWLTRGGNRIAPDSDVRV